MLIPRTHASWRRLSLRYLLLLAFLAYVAAFLGLLAYHIVHRSVPTIAVIGFAFLAFMIALCGLLYNRARAYNSGQMRLRTLYAAERTFRACAQYTAGLLWVFASTIMVQWSVERQPGSSFSADDFAIYIFAFVFFVFSFYELFVAVVVLMRIAGSSISPKSILRSLRSDRHG